MNSFLALQTAKRKWDAEKSSVSKPKVRKYEDNYLAYGFTRNVVNKEERPLCLICLKTLSNETMKPAKLKRHLETMHTALASKPLAYFEAQLKAYNKQKAPIERTPKDSQCAQVAAYKVAHRIVRARKPHTIAENLLLPAGIDMVTAFGAKDVAKQIQIIPLSNTLCIASRRSY